MKRIFLVVFVLLNFSNSLWAQKPNIIWLTCEDISPTLSMYGDSTAYTPSLDKLAAESIIYTKAFATVGVCGPSRSSIITGMYPISIGTQHMRTGKDIFGWGNRDYSKPSKAMDINGEPIPLYSVVTPAKVKCFTEYLRAEGYYCTNNDKTDYQFASPITAWDDNSKEAHWKNRNEGQPFFAVFNFGVSHESRIWKNKDLPLTVKPGSVPLPSYYPENAVVRKDVARNYSNIELLDQQIGQKLKELEEAGLLENTIVFFFSDHGGPLPRGKREHYDSGLKVPFMVRLPKQLQQQYNAELISFVDLAPTMMSLTGIKKPEYMQGQAFLGGGKQKKERAFVFGSGDRFDEFTDRVRTARSDQFLYVRNYHKDLPAYKDIGYRKNIDMMNELLRLKEEGELNESQMYWFRTRKTSEELYNCITDPENLHNLIEDKTYNKEIEQLRIAMDDWLKTVGDKGSISEKEYFLQMWPNGNQPVSEKPQIDLSKNDVILSCKTEGASIAYLISKENTLPGFDAGWQLYHEPIKVEEGEILYVQSHRIGFKESEIEIVEF